MFKKSVLLSNLYLWLFFIFCLIFLYTIGIDAMKGNIDFEFYADTETYMSISEENYSFQEILLINPNLIGPYTILRLLGNSYYFVFFLNFLIFSYFFLKLNKLYDLNRNLLLVLLIISPIMFGSLIGINKEIFSVLVIALMLVYHKKQKYIYIFLAFLLAFLVRWQMALFVLVYTVMTSKFNPIKDKFFLNVFVFLALVSILYPLNLSSFEDIDSVASEARDNKVEGSGLFSILISIQNYPFGYLIVFIPKALFLLGGILFRFYKVFDFSDIYNNLFIFIQSLLSIILLVQIVRKKISIHNHFIYMGVLYCIIFCLSPIYAPRYLFPCYIFMALALSERKFTDLSLDQSEPIIN